MAALSTYSATVKSGLHEKYGATIGAVTKFSALRSQAAFHLSRKSTLALRQVMRALNGTAAGGNATKTYGRVEANVELGGKRTIEVQTLVNATTVAQDKTDIDNTILAFTSYNTSFPANGDGNPLGIVR